MEILKGMVKDAGYPDVECTYAKIDDNTLYYFIKDGELSNGNYIASNVLKEAIEHAPFTSLGIIDRNGNILVPFENKVIKRVKDDLLLVEKNVPTSENVLNAIELRKDALKAQELAEESKKIKNQVTEVMGMNGTIVFDNHFSEATLYTMDGINVAGGYYSYIAELDSNYYFATNKVDDQIITFNPSMLEENTNVDANSSFDLSQNENENDLKTNLPMTDLEENNLSSENTKEEKLDLSSNESITETNTDVSDTQEDTDTQINLEQEEINEENTNNIDTPDIPLVSNSLGTEDNEKSVTDEASETTAESSESSEDSGIVNEEINNQEDSNFDEKSEQIDENQNEDSNSDFIDNDTNNFDFPTEEDKIIESSEENMKLEPEESINENTNESLFNDIDKVSNDKEDLSAFKFTKENYTSPVIADATNTIKRLLNENKNQREIIDKQTGELEAYKSNYDILMEDNNLKKQEIVELRDELNKYRNQTISLTRDNTKLKGTLMRQSQIMKSMEDQNVDLRRQVAGFSELNKAVAEAGVLITPIEGDSAFGGLSKLYDEDDYSKKKAA